MVDFQFMSGLNTIGGNILDIRSENGRLIFDYGEISDPKTGQLPDLSQPTENTAIFISHLHIDHVGSFKYIPKDIPIYMSQESYDLYKQLVKIGEELPIKANVYPMRYNDTIDIGDIVIMAKQSDHDIRGAFALFVETPDVKLIYSGDLRLTGNHPEYVKGWIQEAKGFGQISFYSKERLIVLMRREKKSLKKIYNSSGNKSLVKIRKQLFSSIHTFETQFDCFT